MKRPAILLLLGLALAGSAEAQSRGRPAARRVAPPPPKPLVSLNLISGIGVVDRIDRAAGRVTLTYGAIEALNWPAGTLPFLVGKSALLDGVAVGDRVRFRLESQQIVELQRLDPAKPVAPASAKASPPTTRPEAAWTVRPEDPR